MNTFIQKSSPLYEYWHSAQSVEDETKRILKISKEKIYQNGLLLFKDEPYKWEILFQSILHEMVKNNTTSTV